MSRKRPFHQMTADINQEEENQLIPKRGGGGLVAPSVSLPAGCVDLNVSLPVPLDSYQEQEQDLGTNHSIASTVTSTVETPTTSSSSSTTTSPDVAKSIMETDVARAKSPLSFGPTTDSSGMMDLTSEDE